MQQGKRDRLFMRKDFSGYMGVRDLDKCFFYYFKEKDIKYLHQLVGMVEDRLRIIKPDYIILTNDTLPIERAIVLASKKLGIITIEIQHGAYMKPSYDSKTTTEPLTDGKAADYILLWGKYFKDLYLEQKIRDLEDIYVLGYPILAKKKLETKKNKGDVKYTVCFLAQGFEKFNKDFFEIKIETARRLFEICGKLGLKFIYRYHPRGENREAISKKLPGVEFTRGGEKLEDTFKRADIFIGVSSTALVEAAIRGKLALQLMNYPIKLDNFEELGACSKSLKNINELENYLDKIAGAASLDEFKKEFSNDYIETRHNSGERLLEILKKIENNKNF